VRKENYANHSKRLNTEALLDVRWWLDVFLTPAGNRRCIYEPAPVTNKHMELSTGACGTGYGARYGKRWSQGTWTAAQLKFARVNVHISMPYLETHALTHAAVGWGQLWFGETIVFRCDAEAAVKAVQKCALAVTACPPFFASPTPLPLAMDFNSNVNISPV